MNKQDIDKASAALTGAKGYFSPIVAALNQADEVFSVLSNAIKLKDALETDVVLLQSVLVGLKDQVTASQVAITTNSTEAVKFKAQAEREIADVKAQADAEVKSIKAGVADRTKKAIADSEAKIAEVNIAAQQAKAIYDKEVAAMSAAKASVQADVDALETKLATLREQAKKFAASLVE
jgi:hypothetical protein